MERPIIGIAANELDDAGKTLHHLPISYTPAGYVRAVHKAGGLPLVLPVGTPDMASDYVSQIDKLILAGGQNVAPDLYGEKVLVKEAEISKERDRFELALIEEAIKQRKPIFAVCRGMQLINVALGGNLYQDLSNDAHSKIAHMQVPVPRQIPTHKIHTKKETILRRIYGEETLVNSFHFQAIKTLASSFKATAYSEDGLIEGIESTDKQIPFLGVQWHPDFAYEYLEQEMSIFRYAVQEL